jgi:hypothetical protein
LCEFRVLLSSFFLSACSASFGLSIPKRERGICGGIAKREFFRVCRGVEVFFFYPRCREREKSEKARDFLLSLAASKRRRRVVENHYANPALPALFSRIPSMQGPRARSPGGARGGIESRRGKEQAKRKAARIDASFFFSSTGG